MKKYFLVTLLFLPLLSIAQSNYKSGYVVNLKGDTLHGYIDQKEWGHNPKSISFKPAPGEKAQQLGLSDINYFKIAGYVSYQRFRVHISLNPVDISSPSLIGDTTSIIDTVFLKIMEKGKNLTLYVYKDGLKERFYIKDSDIDVPTELLYGIYQDIGSDNAISKKTYQVQLIQTALKYNCGTDKLIREVRQSGYNEDDLIQIAAQINGDTQAQASLKSGNSSAIRFFGGAALISSTIKAGQYYGSPTSTSSSPKITIGADVIVNPGVGHLIFRLELAYAVNNYNIHDDIPNPIYNIENPETNLIKLQQNVIFITPQVIYNIYNADKFKVFVDVGYSLNLLSYPKNQVITYQYGTTAVTDLSKTFDSKGEYSAFQFKAGAVLSKRFEIYGAWSPGADIVNSLNYSTNLTSYQVGVNYFLGKGAR